ncbi:MAG: hypothetical protein GY769_18220 [bacterium]|nr:hypothetical protein [bacterium]
MHPIRRLIPTVLAAVVTMAALPAIAVADSHEEEAPRPYAYGIYYECDTSTQEQADHIMKHVFKPVYDQGVEDGTITGWGWMAHAVGGKWRRVVYLIAPTIDEVLEASNTLNTKVGEADPLGANRLQQLCPSHDDYIWRWVAGSSEDAGEITEQRGDVAFSAYWVCDMSKESDLDDMIREKIGPLWDAQVEAGNLASWAWFEHVIGGKYRRLASQTAKDFGSITKAREAVINELVENHPDVMAEFSTTCHSHQDYLWEVMMETP